VRHIEILGVPYNSSGLTNGVARAPAALRRAGLVDALRGAGIAVADAGDVVLGPTSPDRDPSSQVISPGILGDMVDAVRDQVERILRDGEFPLIIGGDCPILLGCLGPGGEASPCGLLFLDGHEDAWPPALSTTGEAADMELGFALGLTTGDLPRALTARLPTVSRGRVIVVGARDADEIAAAGVASINDLVPVIRPEVLLERGPTAVAAHAVSRLSDGGDWWLHVDLDVLSSESLPAVDYEQPGGLDWPALTQITQTALASDHCRGWTVTIYNPDLDPEGDGAKAIVSYIAESLRP
jgi:arginase